MSPSPTPLHFPHAPPDGPSTNKKVIQKAGLVGGAAHHRPQGRYSAMDRVRILWAKILLQCVRHKWCRAQKILLQCTTGKSRTGELAPVALCDIHVAGCAEHLPAWGLHNDRILGTDQAIRGGRHGQKLHSGFPPRQVDARSNADAGSSAGSCLSKQKVQGQEANRRRHRLAEPTTKALCQPPPPPWTQSVHLDAPGQRHGQQPVSRTADPRSNETGQVIQGLQNTFGPRMCKGEGPMGAAKGRQTNTMASCHTPHRLQ